MLPSLSSISRIALALVVAVLCSPARAQAPDIRDLMTSDEFEAAGLDKLTAEELEALNQWIVRYTARDAPEVRRKNEAVLAEVEKVEADGIRTRIVGEFRGWSGRTVFRLENGQIWKQRLPGRWYYRAESPEVVLRKNTMGFWEMKLIEANRGIGVTRID